MNLLHHWITHAIFLQRKLKSSLNLTFLLKLTITDIVNFINRDGEYFVHI